MTSEANRDFAVELEPLVEQTTERMRDLIGQADWFRRATHRIDPGLAALIGRLGPYGVSFLVDRIGLNALGATAGPLAKSFFINLATKLGSQVSEEADPVRRAEAAQQAANEVTQQVVAEMQLKLDPYFGFVHLADCPQVQQLESQLPRPQGRKGQPAPPPRQFVVISPETAIERGLQVAPCCFAGIDNRLKKQASGKKKQAKNRFASRSPLEVIGQMSKKDWQKFDAWLGTVPPEERPRLFRALQELDSREEFIGLMALPPEIRAEALPLLENRNFLTPVKQFLRTVGAKLMAGGRWSLEKLSAAWQTAKAWDEEHFRDLADEAQERFQSLDAEGLVEETEELDSWPVRFWRGVTDFFGLFNPLR